MMVIGPIDFLRQLFRRHAGEGFHLTNKVRLIIKVEGMGDIGEVALLPCFQQAHRFVEPFDPDVGLCSDADRLLKPALKLAFRKVQGLMQVLNRNCGDLPVN